MSIDQSVDACTDFYQHACSNWITENPAPERQGRWVRRHESASAVENKMAISLWRAGTSHWPH
jgi:hypothetical protein